MRLVTQRCNTDCGIATIAMLTDRSYTDVLRTAVRLFGYPEEGPYTTTFADMRGMLRHYGMEPTGTRRFRAFDRIGQRAAVLINYSHPTSVGHWVAYEHGARTAIVLNPGWWLKRQRITNLQCIRPTHFVSVSARA